MYEEGVEQVNENLESGVLCLEFANTSEWHASAHPVESLNSYTDLVGWGRRVELLDQAEVQRLQLKASKDAEAANAILQEAIHLRDTIYRIFEKITNQQAPASEDLDSLNAMLAKALPHLRVIRTGDGFRWTWSITDEALNRLFWAVTCSTADLLTSERLARVKQCEDDRGCGFLFLDLSKNRSRRWCSMESCGNRAKVRRYRKRAQT